MKIKVHLTILFQFLLSFLAFSQQIKLSGQVFIFNSKYNTGNIQYINDAYVTAPYSKPSYSDDYGMFNIEFVGIDAGTSVEVKVNKIGFEVVNLSDLQAVIIGRNSPLLIYMAKKGQLATTQMEFYNISRKVIYAEKDAIIARLNSNKEESQQVINELNKKYGQKFTDHFEAVDFLNKRIEELEIQLPEFAQRLATENLDFASKLYIQAYELLKQGEIENVIKILDENTLEKNYLKAKDDIVNGKKLENDAKKIVEKGRLEILQTVNSLLLKAETEMLLFDFEKAIKLYEKSLDICISDEISELLVFYLYDKIGTAYSSNGQYMNALDYRIKALQLNEKNIDNLMPLLAASNHNLASSYRDIGNFQKALDYELKALAIREESKNPANIDLAFSYDCVAGIYRDLGKYQKALYFEQLALKLFESNFNPKDANLATFYNNFSLTYQALGQYQNALKYQLKSLAINEELFGSESLNLTTSFENIAGIYNDLGDFEKAIQFEKKSLLIREKVLNRMHPNLATSYNNISLYYQSQGDFSIAEYYQQKAIDIREKILDSQHPYLATSYNNLSIININLKNYDKALEFQLKAIAIFKNIYEPTHPFIAICYLNLASIYFELKEFTKALEYQLYSITILEQVYDPNHPKLAIAYTNIAETYLITGNKKKALEYQLKARKIIEMGTK